MNKPNLFIETQNVSRFSILELRFTNRYTIIFSRQVFFYSDQALNCYVLSLRGNEKFKWGKNGTK